MSHFSKRHSHRHGVGAMARIVAASLAAPLVPVTVTHAQSGTEAASGPTSVLLETVLVSARKRAINEAAEDTPVAISAFGAAQIEAVFN